MCVIGCVYAVLFSDSPPLCKYGLSASSATVDGSNLPRHRGRRRVVTFGGVTEMEREDGGGREESRILQSLLAKAPVSTLTIGMRAGPEWV